MSSTSLPKVDTNSPNILKDLRNFRFQKKAIKKMFTSDEDSNLAAPEVRRKTVNRIEDSESDEERLTKNSVSHLEQKSELKRKEQLKYLINLYPHYGNIYLKNILHKVNWDLEIAKKEINKIRKRSCMKTSKSKKHKRKKYKDQGDDVNSNEEGHFSEDKVFDSDESDIEISNTLTHNKKAVFNFMQNALPTELLLMNQCSQKKVNAIIEARPFNGWKDLVEKFQSIKFLDTELLNAAQDLIQTRNVVGHLMKKCLHLSINMEKAISAGSSTIKEQPKGLNANLTLAPYQMVGLNWFAVLHTQNVNGILADEMGLGKTVQIIAFLTYLDESGLINETDGPHLIIVPSSTIENWSNEFNHWSPNLKVVKYYGSQEERRQMRFGWRSGDLDNIDIILTTYNLISATPEERRLFRVLPLKYVIFDEAHMLKNMSTLRYENLIKINSQHRILLTGTPLQNNLLELISLLIFVMPSMFAGKQDDLKSLFSKNPKINANKSIEDKPLFEEEQVKNAKQIMKPFVLRRLKVDVLKDLPRKTTEVIVCPMIKEQKDMYTRLVAKFSAEADENDEVNGIGMMMQLRKLANHPLLLQNYYREDKLRNISKRLISESSWKQKDAQYTFEELIWMSDYKINQLSRTFKSIAGFGLPQSLISESGKLKKLDKLLPELKNEGHRVLIFSQFTIVLDILEEYLTINNYRYLRLDGQTPVIERQDLIDEFIEDTDIFIFLLSTRAGGLGINLTCADTVIIHDIDFNPYNDKQAEDRCHRIGQRKPVRIIRLLCQDSIEEGMYKIAQDKLKLEQKLTGNEENESTEKKGILKLLKMILGIDHNKTIALSHNKNGINGYIDNN
ncbi:PREDICTED: SWI/SNF-related matrix-associated actin-dependent regulator of chromatin subfamily A containing DEAD/H box 1 homolog [Ceratosolen solmsi marchali]|uniref:SWI/SNF-related matrix-associated actin-dependent regulator of chromatin subfamily A containing DEAD/H box 1 homolog n=1 Tax=Ceratosolen solmsi marchali TaxID=326594 RepID=A0AAJ6YSL6_9HYME|nr:PREDICTED: SWI/SNF-related matrix-associated actin-dependent regulator of chromatin subfamily A containing DEAD/H box 1 homolog [Ceratosolen solmsi marchali]